MKYQNYKTRSFLILLLAAALLCGCSISDLFSGDPDAGKKPDTSTITDRISYLDSSLSEPDELNAGETGITIRLAPQFVLHVNSDNKIVRFEALNEQAHALKKATKKEWNKKPVKKALRSILERCVTDGYISDVIPEVEIIVSDPSSEIAEKTRAVAEEVLLLHGISTELNLH
jgi:hypothetical protein